MLSCGACCRCTVGFALAVLHGTPKPPTVAHKQRSRGISLFGRSVRSRRRNIEIGCAGTKLRALDTQIRTRTPSKADTVTKSRSKPDPTHLSRNVDVAHPPRQNAIPSWIARSWRLLRQRSERCGECRSSAGGSTASGAGGDPPRASSALSRVLPPPLRRFVTPQPLPALQTLYSPLSCRCSPLQQLVLSVS